MVNVKLRKVLLSDEKLFQEQHKNFANDDFNFAFHYNPEQPFAEYVEYMKQCRHRTFVDNGEVPATFLLVENSEGHIVGRVSIRHELNEFLSKIGGHIGYGVLHKFRRQGYGMAMLREALVYTKENLNLDKVLVTCDEGNEASQKIIEATNATYEGLYSGSDAKIPKRRYWIKI